MSKILWGILILGFMVVIGTYCIGCADAGQQKMMSTEEALRVYPGSQEIELFLYKKVKVVDPKTKKESIQIALWKIRATTDSMVGIPVNPATIDLNRLKAFNAEYGITPYQHVKVPQAKGGKK